MACVIQTPSLVPTRPASTEEWLAIKPVFLRLYLDENKKLEQVRRELDEKHNFRATVKAYKRRITEWKAFKNYKAAEKESLAQHESLMKGNHVSNINIQLRGKPVKWYRVQRHQRAKILNGLRHIHNHQTHAMDAGHPMFSLHNPPLFLQPSDSHQTMFCAVKNFYQWSFHTSCHVERWDGPSVLVAINDFFGISEIISESSNVTTKQNAWAVADKMCSKLPELIKSGNEAAIWYAIVRLSDSVKDERQQRLSCHVVNYMWNLCLRCLRPPNPLFQLLTTLGTETSVLPIKQYIAKMYFDIFGVLNLISNAKSNPWNFLSYLQTLIRNGQPDLAYQIVERALTSGSCNDLTRFHCLAFKARLSLVREDFELSVKQWYEHVECSRALGTKDAAAITVWYIACYYERRGDWKKADRYYNLAVEPFFYTNTPNPHENFNRSDSLKMETKYNKRLLKIFERRLKDDYFSQGNQSDHMLYNMMHREMTSGRCADG